MKTLIINGSPRKNGDTTALTDELMRHLDGEVKVISCYDNISPCIDCRYCWQHEGCALRDGLQPLYAYLADCDCVVLASPVWFSSLASPALAIGSRLQTYFAAKFFRHTPAPLPPKRGVILITGAQPGTEEHPIANATTMLGLAGVKREDITVVRSMNTDRVPASEDRAALTAAADAARALSASPR